MRKQNTFKPSAFELEVKDFTNGFYSFLIVIAIMGLVFTGTCAWFYYHSEPTEEVGK